MSKTYTSDNVTYKSGGRKWTFTVPTISGTDYSFSRDLKGGAETAHKVARIIMGAFKRNPKALEIDNMARANISTVIHNAGKMLNATRIEHRFPEHRFSFVPQR